MMMLHRSSSSRRRRASRGTANSSPSSGSSSVGSRSRRASVATEKPIILTQGSNSTLNRQKSPRRSMVPNIALDTESDSAEENLYHRVLPDVDHYNSSRGSLAPEANRSPRNSLVPEDYPRNPRSPGSDMPRSPRNSLTPDTINRSPRNSLTPEISHSPRHSLVPESAMASRNSLIPDQSYNRSPRNSLVPLGGSRTSLMPENGVITSNRSPRHSLVPETSRSPRGSVANLEFDRSPRGSICPDMSRTPRGSITPMEVDRSPRGSIASECLNQSPRGSIAPDPNRSPRGSIAPEGNRSPRGSICPDSSNRSPRGSIAPHDAINRSPRGSIGVNDVERHSRGSLAGDDENRSPRGSIGPDAVDRSPRGSLGGQERKTKVGLEDPRRASADQGTRTRSSSPYRQKDTNSSIRAGGNGTQVCLGYGTNAWAESRRASSSVSQFSGDESRRLCSSSVKIPEKGLTEKANIATYGSVVFQLKDAHLEANGTFDFVFRGLRVVSKTMIVTVCLAFLSTMPILMFILGLKYVRDCPREPHIPVYMIVGGVVGAIQMSWTLYSQIRSRRPEIVTVPNARAQMSPMELVSITLSCFLAVWFALGNYWILNIKWPAYEPTLYEPNVWCNKTLYISSFVHLCVVYGVIVASFLVAVGLAFCRILACPWPERYK